MRLRVLTALTLFVIPVVAEPGLFHQIRNKAVVTLVMPQGECEAEVVQRALDQLTLRLKKTTDACGKVSSRVRLSLRDVEDIVDNRRPAVHGGDMSRSKACALFGLLLGGYAGVAVAEKTGRDEPVVPLIAAGGIGGAVLCRDRGSRFSVFIKQVVRAQP